VKLYCDPIMEDDSDKTVFISYAREDSPEAEKLYEILKEAGTKPWMDKKEIRPGQNWRLAISKAIKNTRYFLPLFSSKWVGKIGYVNKELKYALDVLDTYPEDAIFIIPVRLDDCEIPFQKLEDKHYADLFPDWNGGIKQIFGSMEIEVKSDNEPREEGEEQWTKGLSDYHWERLLENIYTKNCVPFIGAGAYKTQNKERSLVPLTKDIVDKLKEKHRYPLEDLYELARIYTFEDSSYQLARLAQFLEIENPEEDEMYPKTLLSKMIKGMESYNIFPFETRFTYDVLADLDLPVYLTTNYDRFLEEALSNKRKKPESDFFRWSNQVMNHVKFFKVSSVFDKPQYKPTEEKPLVYHILGDINTPQSMVLTEKDYFDFVVNTNKREGDRDMYPPILRTELGSSSLLFIGYTLDDINFRTIFQGFLTFLDSLGKSRKLSIAVQLPPQISKKGQTRMQKYLEKYTRNMFPNVHIFWGDTFEFVTELDKRLKEFKKKNNDDMNIDESKSPKVT
jgi:hypothetical protein